MKNFTFSLGDYVTDIITGFNGVITARCDHITGCNTYGLNPRKMDKDGKPLGVEWFDENRLTLLEENVISIKKYEDDGPDSVNPDGSFFNRD